MIDDATRSGRRAGIVLPLFACASSTSWGIGEIGDIVPLTAWLAAAGHRVLQLLPLNEMAPGQQSPYSAISAMAIDPIFITLSSVPEFAALGGENALSPDDRRDLAELRAAPVVDHRRIRRLKQAAFGAAFDRFASAEWERRTARARALSEFVAAQAWWIEDYSLFRAIHAREGEQSWHRWPEALRRREPRAIDAARRELEREVLFYQYLQWLAATEWHDVRRRTSDIAVFGDLPFMVDTDSADVWARQDQFRFDVSVGVPPDAFSETGQDWRVPMYDWSVIGREDFRWLRERARRNADLYDGYRVDHLVGFYRTYGRPLDGRPPFFAPADEPSQVAQGERLLELFRNAGAEIIAEDLGTVPDFVRASLSRLDVPGFRVLRWERDWEAEDHPFRDPSGYPAGSVATSGTHDTEPLGVWWESISDDERRMIAALPTVRRISGGADLACEDYETVVRDVLLEAIEASGSNLVLLPIQDVFGWSDRINEPATVSHRNWAFRLPWPVDRLDEIPAARERRDTLRRWSDRYRRHR